MIPAAAQGGDTQGRRSAAPALAVVVVALLLLAGHSLRSFDLPFVLIFALLPLLLFVRRPWAARVVQAALLFGVLEWVTATVRILGERRATGEPAGRMLVIMGGVVGFTLLAALLLESAGPRRRFGLRTGRLFETAPSAPAPVSPFGGQPRGAPSREDMRVVAAFSEVFSRPGFVAGSWIHPESEPDGTVQISHWEPALDVQRWHDALYRHGLVVLGHEWSAADRREEMARFQADPSALASADLDTIRRVLTTMARADRFTEGFLDSMFEAGVAQAATRRLAALAGADGAPNEVSEPGGAD
ncbi:MAG: DUF6508 domain-containing protein [Thermoleophilia bacterium]